MKDARAVVKRALITEKGTALRELRNQYHFEVAVDALVSDRALAW